MQISKGIRDSRSLFTRAVLKGGPIEPREIVDAYINANRAMFDVKKNLKGDMDAARLLDIIQECIESLDRVSSQRNSIIWKYLDLTFQLKFKSYLENASIKLD